MDRYEGRKDGSDDGPLTNDIECVAIHDFLWRLLNHQCAANLKDEIFVASPYNQQAENLRHRLSSGRGFCSDHPAAPHRNVEIDTTDSLQGSERYVAVISLTRSNRSRHVGFLNDERRLNVAFTRSRKVLCVVEDFSTMERCGIAMHLYNSALQGYPRTVIQFFQPPFNRIYRFQRNQVQRITR